MEFEEAFKSLGYKLESFRQDWTAERDDGICITIWTKQTKVKDGLPYLDCWEIDHNGDDFMEGPAHKKRTLHLERAMNEFDGLVDVILVSGPPGGSYENATPWDSKKRKGSWKIVKFCSETGFFRAEVVRD